MTDPSTVLPGPRPSGVLRVQGTSKLAFGATTAALVTLASGGTALLVARGTSPTVTSLPAGALFVDPAVGSAVIVGEAIASAVKPGQQGDATRQALADALARRADPGRRTLTAPLIRVGPGAQGSGTQGAGAPTGSGGPVVVTPPTTAPPAVTPAVVATPTPTPTKTLAPPVHRPRTPGFPPTPPPGGTPTADPTDVTTAKDEAKANAKDRAKDGEPGVAEDRDGARKGKARHVRSGRHSR